MIFPETNNFNLQITSQLMETVKQNVKLAQQLEQCEVDMQFMLQEQLRDKQFSNYEGNSSENKYEKSRITNRILLPSSFISFFLKP